MLAAFFEKIKLRDNLQRIIPLNENSPNGSGIYSKLPAYILAIYAEGNRFSHLLYLGCLAVFASLHAATKLPLASTALTRFFSKINKHKKAEEMSEGLWKYLSMLIPWRKLIKDWLTFDSSAVKRYGRQEGVKRGYNPKKKGRGSHNPLLAFLNKHKYAAAIWNSTGNIAFMKQYPWVF